MLPKQLRLPYHIQLQCEETAIQTVSIWLKKHYQLEFFFILFFLGEAFELDLIATCIPNEVNWWVRSHPGIQYFFSEIVCILKRTIFFRSAVVIIIHI